jgi:hypothetical protein
MDDAIKRILFKQRLRDISQEKHADDAAIMRMFASDAKTPTVVTDAYRRSEMASVGMGMEQWSEFIAEWADGHPDSVCP